MNTILYVNLKKKGDQEDLPLHTTPPPPFKTLPSKRGRHEGRQRYRNKTDRMGDVSGWYGETEGHKGKGIQRQIQKQRNLFFGGVGGTCEMGREKGFILLSMDGVSIHLFLRISNVRNRMDPGCSTKEPTKARTRISDVEARGVLHPKERGSIRGAKDVHRLRSISVVTYARKEDAKSLASGRSEL